MANNIIGLIIAIVSVIFMAAVIIIWAFSSRKKFELKKENYFYAGKDGVKFKNHASISPSSEKAIEREKKLKSRC